MTTVENDRWLPVRVAARELNTTPLNLLMHLKKGIIVGRETLDGWQVSATSLERYRHNQGDSKTPGLCHSGCKGCGAHSTGPKRVEKRIAIAPSDLRFKYRRGKNPAPRFTGLPDDRPFDRGDLNEVLPMFEVLMTALQTEDGRVLMKMEEVLNGDLPLSITTRAEVYEVLYHCMRDILELR